MERKRNRNLLQLHLLTAMMLHCLNINAQTLHNIADIRTKYQHCLDSGTHMQECARNYQLTMYEMLDSVYDKLVHKLFSKEKSSLIQEQGAWLLKRKKFEKNQENDFQKKYKSGEYGSDMFMVVYDADAEFSRKRTEELIKRLKKLP